MKRSARILIGVVLGYAAVWAAVASWRTCVPFGDPHGFMKDPARCKECHLEEKPEKGRSYQVMNFRRDIYSLCERCHKLQVTHPVDVAPGQRLSLPLPLDPDGTMTCVTCHAPHSAAHSKTQHTGRSLSEKIRDTVLPGLPQRFRTMFLRIPTPGGQLCDACHAGRPIASVRKDITVPGPEKYIGSRNCEPCHPDEYRAWRLSPHARMLRSPRKDPGALVASFDPSPPFPSSEIAFVLGSRNVQRFISRKEDSLVVRTPIWLIRARKWNLNYWRELDWMKLCAGCHTTGLDPFRGVYAEEGISCEACHGPGRAHAASGEPGEIVNPAKLPSPRREMVCESCHTTGHDVTGEFRYPVGYLPGEDLHRFYSGLTPKPGQDDTTFLGDGTVEDRHRQYRYWESRMLVAEGETCDLCKNFREGRKGGQAGGPKVMTPEEFCRSCHDGTLVPPAPLHDSPPIAGRPCLECHPVRKNKAGEPSIHDHRYIPASAMGKNGFIPPGEFRSICFGCHPAPAKEQSA